MNMEVVDINIIGISCEINNNNSIEKQHEQSINNNAINAPPQDRKKSVFEDKRKKSIFTPRSAENGDVNERRKSLLRPKSADKLDVSERRKSLLRPKSPDKEAANMKRQFPAKYKVLDPIASEIEEEDEGSEEEEDPKPDRRRKIRQSSIYDELQEMIRLKDVIPDDSFNTIRNIQLAQEQRKREDIESSLNRCIDRIELILIDGGDEGIIYRDPKLAQKSLRSIEIRQDYDIRMKKTEILYKHALMKALADMSDTLYQRSYIMSDLYDWLSSCSNLDAGCLTEDEWDEKFNFIKNLEYEVRNAFSIAMTATHKINKMGNQLLKEAGYVDDDLSRGSRRMKPFDMNDILSEEQLMDDKNLDRALKDVKQVLNQSFRSLKSMQHKNVVKAGIKQYKNICGNISKRLEMYNKLKKNSESLKDNIIQAKKDSSSKNLVTADHDSTIGASQTGKKRKKHHLRADGEDDHHKRRRSKSRKRHDDGGGTSVDDLEDSDNDDEEELEAINIGGGGGTGGPSQRGRSGRKTSTGDTEDSAKVKKLQRLLEASHLEIESLKQQLVLSREETAQLQSMMTMLDQINRDTSSMHHSLKDEAMTSLRKTRDERDALEQQVRRLENKSAKQEEKLIELRQELRKRSDVPWFPSLDAASGVASVSSRDTGTVTSLGTLKSPGSIKESPTDTEQSVAKPKLARRETKKQTKEREQEASNSAVKKLEKEVESLHKKIKDMQEKHVENLKDMTRRHREDIETLLKRGADIFQAVNRFKASMAYLIERENLPRLAKEVQQLSDMDFSELGETINSKFEQDHIGETFSKLTADTINILANIEFKLAEVLAFIKNRRREIIPMRKIKDVVEHQTGGGRMQGLELRQGERERFSLPDDMPGVGKGTYSVGAPATPTASQHPSDSQASTQPKSLKHEARKALDKAKQQYALSRTAKDVTGMGPMIGSAPRVPPTIPEETTKGLPEPPSGMQYAMVQYPSPKSSRPQSSSGKRATPSTSQEGLLHILVPDKLGEALVQMTKDQKSAPASRSPSSIGSRPATPVIQVTSPSHDDLRPGTDSRGLSSASSLQKSVPIMSVSRSSDEGQLVMSLSGNSQHTDDVEDLRPLPSRISGRSSPATPGPVQLSGLEMQKDATDRAQQAASAMGRIVKDLKEKLEDAKREILEIKKQQEKSQYSPSPSGGGCRQCPHCRENFAKYGEYEGNEEEEDALGYSRKQRLQDDLEMNIFDQNKCLEELEEALKRGKISKELFNMTVDLLRRAQEIPIVRLNHLFNKYIEFKRKENAKTFLRTQVRRYFINDYADDTERHIDDLEDSMHWCQVRFRKDNNSLEAKRKIKMVHMINMYNDMQIPLFFKPKHRCLYDKYTAMFRKYMRTSSVPNMPEYIHGQSLKGRGKDGKVWKACPTKEISPALHPITPRILEYDVQHGLRVAHRALAGMSVRAQLHMATVKGYDYSCGTVYPIEGKSSVEAYDKQNVRSINITMPSQSPLPPSSPTMHQSRTPSQQRDSSASGEVSEQAVVATSTTPGVTASPTITPTYTGTTGNTTNSASGTTEVTDGTLLTNGKSPVRPSEMEILETVEKSNSSERNKSQSNSRSKSRSSREKLWSVLGSDSLMFSNSSSRLSPLASKSSRQRQLLSTGSAKFLTPESDDSENEFM